MAGGCSSEVCSSVHAVVHNEDLLIEILLRLPIISLRVFKSVSKHWLSLITNPNFTLRWSQSPILDPPSGLFLQRDKNSFEYEFVRLDSRIPASRSPSTTTFTLGKLEILQSCNGLLLCRIGRGKFYVYNPSTNRLKRIPQCKSIRLCCDLRMAFDPSKSPHYKIVCTGFIEKNNVYSTQLQIYSSETCNWSVCGDRFPLCFRDFNDGVYLNDAIHWLSVRRDLLFKLDIDHLFITSIQTPTTAADDDLKANRDQKLLFQSCGSLSFLCTRLVKSLQLNIYVMREWYSGWSVKYIVNLDDIMMKYPKSWSLPRCSSVRCIMIGNKEEDSFVVMEIYGKILRYKIVSKAICKLYELGSNESSVCFEFIASSANP